MSRGWGGVVSWKKRAAKKFLAKEEQWRGEEA